MKSLYMSRKKRINVYPSAAVFFVFDVFLRLSCGNSGISSNLLKSTELKIKTILIIRLK